MDSSWLIVLDNPDSKHCFDLAKYALGKFSGSNVPKCGIDLINKRKAPAREWSKNYLLINFNLFA